MTTLTQPEHRAILFINEFAAERGYPPTIRQIAAGLGMKSPSGAHRLVEALEDAGMLHREGQRRRTIRIITSVPTPADLQRLSDADLQLLAERVGAELDRRGEP